MPLQTTFFHAIGVMLSTDSCMLVRPEPQLLCIEAFHIGHAPATYRSAMTTLVSLLLQQLCYGIALQVQTICFACCSTTLCNMSNMQGVSNCHHLLYVVCQAVLASCCSTHRPCSTTLESPAAQCMQKALKLLYLDRTT